MTYITYDNLLKMFEYSCKQLGGPWIYATPGHLPTMMGVIHTLFFQRRYHGRSYILPAEWLVERQSSNVLFNGAVD